MKKAFLFASSSRKIKSHVVESRITSLVCPSLVYHLQKNNTQLITWSFLMIQSVSFTSAAFEIRHGSWQMPRHLPSHINVFYETEHRYIVLLAKVQQQNEWKKKPGVSEYGPWIFWSFSWHDFVVQFLHRL